MTSKDDNVKVQYQERWRGLDQSTKNEVKGLILQSLGTEETHQSSAAQVIAGVACAELPHNEWPVS